MTVTCKYYYAAVHFIITVDFYRECINSNLEHAMKVIMSITRNKAREFSIILMALSMKVSNSNGYHISVSINHTMNGATYTKLFC